MILLLRNAEGGLAVVTSGAEIPQKFKTASRVFTDASSDFSALNAATELQRISFIIDAVDLIPQAPTSCELDELDFVTGLEAASYFKQEVLIPVVFLKNCEKFNLLSPRWSLAVSACDCRKPTGKTSSFVQLVVETFATRKTLLQLI